MGGAEVREGAQSHLVILSAGARLSLMQIKLSGESSAT
jgi:hypothetical protein